MPGIRPSSVRRSRVRKLLAAVIASASLAGAAACGSGGAKHVAATASAVDVATSSSVAATTTTAHKPKATTTTTTTVATTTTQAVVHVAATTTTSTTLAVAVCNPVPFDPAQPINLCGTPGVTPAEELRADALVVQTIRDLPHFANVQTAYNAGYRTIGDGDTGYEHYVNWAFVDNATLLDPTQPESLVYKVSGSTKTLVAAMYMLPRGSHFTDIPDVGGPLTQWHVHSDLCFKTNPSDHTQQLVDGQTDSQGDCPVGDTKAGNTPMIHVWIVKNSCGPFASLTGIGGGQLEPGESRLCDTLHGSR